MLHDTYHSSISSYAIMLIWWYSPNQYRYFGSTLLYNLAKGIKQRIRDSLACNADAFRDGVVMIMKLLPKTYNCGLRMRRECRERFPRHRRSAIPACITARVACRDRNLEIFPCSRWGETFPPLPAHDQPAILRIYQEARGYSSVIQEKLERLSDCFVRI